MATRGQGFGMEPKQLAFAVIGFSPSRQPWLQLRIDANNEASLRKILGVLGAERIPVDLSAAGDKAANSDGFGSEAADPLVRDGEATDGLLGQGSPADPG